MEFLMVLFIFPLLTFLFGVIGQIFLKKIYIVVGITFLGWLIAAFTVFNVTFLLWVFIYSALSLLGSGLVFYLKKLKSE